jgi:phospholipase/carboxylesterase
MRKQRPAPQVAHAGVLTARPQPVTAPAPVGHHVLHLGQPRDGLLAVPARYHPSHPAPLALMLHGAGASAAQGLALLQPWAEAAGVLVLAPDARGVTWDVILSAYGPDVVFIERALAQTFQQYAIDPTHVAIGGFSDGASYALSLGLTNGDLFTHVSAFSPGFLAPTRQRGRPQLFVAHGTRDAVLPIDRCSRQIVRQVRQAGYAVQYHEFDGPHTLPPVIAQEAVAWFTAAAR